MKGYWDSLFGLNYERSIWVEQDDLGEEKVIKHKRKRYSVKIPRKINGKVTLRLRGLGRKRGNKTGDLLLHVWLNKGDDIGRALWLSEKSARNGATKTLSFEQKKIQMFVPPNSYHGLTVRLRGLGRELDFQWRAPFLHRKRGNLLVKLFVYPDTIAPKYGSFDSLATDDMALEGWVYLRIDEITRKMSKSSFLVNPIRADAVADLFNERGWRGIFRALVDHLKLPYHILTIETSDSISVPGACQKHHILQGGVASRTYRIIIHERYLDNPFSVAAILAHELCHVVYSERIEEKPRSVGYPTQSGQASLEEERTVDLLVFMFKIGEFQLRFSRDTGCTLGYFNQSIFERIQVIVSRKLNLD
jgi:hypothetical protein